MKLHKTSTDILTDFQKILNNKLNINVNAKDTMFHQSTFFHHSQTEDTN